MPPELTFGELLAQGDEARKAGAESPAEIYVWMRVKSTGLPSETARKILQRWIRLHMRANGGSIDEEKFGDVLDRLWNKYPSRNEHLEEQLFDHIRHPRDRAITTPARRPERAGRSPRRSVVVRSSARRASRDEPLSDGDDEPPLARQPLTSERLFLDAWGLWPWSGWTRIAAEAKAEREAYLASEKPSSTDRRLW
jgi:hypothetical protein